MTVYELIRLLTEYPAKADVSVCVTGDVEELTACTDAWKDFYRYNISLNITGADIIWKDLNKGEVEIECKIKKQA